MICKMGNDVKHIVNLLARKYGTRNPLELAEKVGCMVKFIDLGSLKGLYTYQQRKRIILLNSACKNTEQNKELDMVAAHELGHAILHRESQCYFFSENTYFLKSKIENEAHTFAAELLIQDADIINNPCMSREQLARVLGYSANFLNYKGTINLT